MLLIADSGSSKTEWICAAPNGAVQHFFTGGFNPYFFSGQEELLLSLSGQLLQLDNFPSAERFDKVVFYGSGCGTPQRCEMVKQALQGYFRAAQIEVYSDMEAAARGLCGHIPGIVAILGTGSNSCVYDGQKITAARPSLGYVLGDEGSGAVIGRRLVTAFLYGEMPSGLATAFESAYKVDRATVLEAVYRGLYPNRYLAAFAPFAAKHLEDPFCRELIYTEFDSFFTRHIAHYPFSDRPVHSVGSIAYHFAPPWRQVLQDRGAVPGRIEISPAAELWNFHRSDHR